MICYCTIVYFQQVSAMAGVLSSLGVGKGDRVVIYMPMVPQTLVAILATIRLGAVHAVIFGGKPNYLIFPEEMSH